MGFGPATRPTLKTALCHIRALVGRNDKFRGPRGRSRAFVCGLSSPVLGLHSVGRLTSGRFCWVCLDTGDFLRPQGAIPLGLYPLRGCWVYCLAPEAPQIGECRRGRRYFWPCRTRVGFGPATGPTLKTALCHIRALVGRFDKYRGLRGRSQGPLGSTRLGSCVIVVAPSSPPLLVVDSTFFTSFLRGMRGHLLRIRVSLAVINDQSK